MNNYFKMNKEKEISVCGIPFSVDLENDLIKRMPLGQKIEVNASGPCSYAYLLGMVMNNPCCCEWWQQGEYNYDNHERVFLGDDLCYIFIVYEDYTQEIVPAIFGYNLWNYELYSKINPKETHLNTFGGPYSEPFSTDPEAQKLLDESLMLNENVSDYEKGSKYIMAVKLQDKPVKLITTRIFPAKTHEIFISSITCLETGGENPLKNVVDPAIFLNRGYTAKLDKLARRLYQYADELPQSVEHIIPNDYTGPVADFSGNGFADILTNVYHLNLHDMATNKVTEEGMPHTSSEGTANFGCYVGFGSYKTGESSYFTHIWTRDVGRVLIELSNVGMSERLQNAAEWMHKFLYDYSARFSKPNWKRIANASEVWGKDNIYNLSGKENDGHAAIMLFIFSLIRNQIVSKEWITENKQQILDAVGWFFWQIENPKESSFNKVLYSDSEASSGEFGGYDLFSNAIGYYALLGYEYIGNYMGWTEVSEKSKKYAELIKSGIYETFILDHPQFGKIFVDNCYDAWTYEYKRFGLLFEYVDIFDYEPMKNDEIARIVARTMAAQKHEFYTPFSGRQMGYGQGYLTQIMLLTDDVVEYTKCLEATAGFCYHKYDHNYIVPEGVITSPQKDRWFRNSDLGNAVQQAETIKSIRLMIGIEDMQPQKGLNFVPRMPIGFDKIHVSNYKVAKSVGENIVKTPIGFGYFKTENGYKAVIKCVGGIKVDTLRFGPYPKGTKGLTIGDYDYVYHTVNKEITDFELEL